MSEEILVVRFRTEMILQELGSFLACGPDTEARTWWGWRGVARKLGDLGSGAIALQQLRCTTAQFALFAETVDLRVVGAMIRR